jgi:hypothetical protein
MACRQKEVFRPQARHQMSAPVLVRRRMGDNYGDKAASSLRQLKSAPVIATVEKLETKTGVNSACERAL